MYGHRSVPSDMKNFIGQFLTDALSPEKRELYFGHPKSDFTRKRKIPFCNLIFHLLSRSSGPLTHNLQIDFGLGKERPSKSALVQQQTKVGERLFRDLFDGVTARFRRNILYMKGLPGKYKVDPYAAIPVFEDPVPDAIGEQRI